MALTITTVADGLQPWAVVLAPDGGLFVADVAYRGVLHVDPGGAISAVAGSGKRVAASVKRGYSGDGGDAREAELTEPTGLALGRDGSLYIADYWCHVVRKVSADGTIVTVAGMGLDEVLAEPDSRIAADPEALWAWYGRDGRAATEARFVGCHDVALDADGNLYVADSENISIGNERSVDSHRIRRVGTDGLITTFAGVGAQGFSGDGGPATEAKLDGPTGVAVGPDGSVYIADQYNNRIRRVDTDGVITTVAGTGKDRYSGDGGPATKAALNYPQKVALDREGNLFIADNWNNRVRRVDSDGVITTVAGNGQEGSSGNGCPPTKASLTPRAIAIAADGTLYIAEGTEDDGRICRVSNDG